MGGSDDEAPPEPEPQADFVCFYCYEYVFTGTLLYRDAEDPQMRNVVCCYKPECRAEWTSTEPEPEKDDTKNYATQNYGKALRGLIEEGDLLKYTSQYVGVSWKEREWKWEVSLLDRETRKVFGGTYNDERAAAKAFDAKARELLGEDASGGVLKKGKKNAGVIRRLNFPTTPERERYDAAIAKLPMNNKCNAGDPAVWGELAGDWFECDADCALEFYNSQHDENVQEGQIGYLCNSHRTNYSIGATPFKPATRHKKKKK